MNPFNKLINIFVQLSPLSNTYLESKDAELKSILSLSLAQ